MKYKPSPKSLSRTSSPIKSLFGSVTSSSLLALIIFMSAFMMLSGVAKAHTIEGCVIKAKAICIENSLSGQSLMGVNTPDSKLRLIDLPSASLTRAASSSLSPEAKKVMAPLKTFNKNNTLSKAARKRFQKEYKQALAISYKCAQKVWSEPETQVQAEKIGQGAESLFYGAWSDTVLNERFMIWFNKKHKSLNKTGQILKSLSLADKKMKQASVAQKGYLSLVLKTFASKPPAGLGCSALRILREQEQWNQKSAELSAYLKYGLSQAEIDEFYGKGEAVRKEIEQGIIGLKNAGASKKDLSVYKYFPMGIWLSSLGY